jgi:hypothetical protein
MFKQKHADTHLERLRFLILSWSTSA